MKSSRRALPIIVGGFYRSGTSLVRRLLDSHSRIHCGPEVKFFKDFYADYLNDELEHVRLFSTARSYSLPEAELLSIFGGALVSFHERAAQLAGKQRWADKNPENALFLDAWTQLLPDGFIFVHVVRHPLDALASLKETRFPRTVPAPFEQKAALCKKFRDAADRYCAQNPETCFILHYEELATAPDATLAALFAFLGEDYEPEITRLFFASERGLGIEDPKIAQTRTIQTDSIGRWVRDLTEDEVAIASEQLGPLVNI